MHPAHYGDTAQTGIAPDSFSQFHPLLKPILETLAGDTAGADRHPPAPGTGLESGLGAKGLADERGPDAASGNVSKKGRVLLLEDDASFREVITDCLTGDGYTVVAVQNGGEGVREVLASDFTLVLCDLNMPWLAGDAFFRAVERIRPSLCQRFVFMTGHQSNPATDAFLKSVDAFVLRKPFPLKNLLDAIAFAECLHTTQSVFDGPVADVIPLPGSESVSSFRSGSATVVETAAVDRVLARARKNVPAPRPLNVPRQCEPQPREGGRSGAVIFTGVALSVVLAGGLWVGNLVARDRLDTAVARRVALDAEWADISPDLQAALAKQSNTAATEKQLARLSVLRERPRWASVLRCITPSADSTVEILGVDVRAGAKDFRTCEVSVHGIAGGAEPRQMADRFRQTMEDKLKRETGGLAVGTRFERLHDAPGVLPDQKRADFVIIATLKSTEPALAMRKEGL